MYATRICLTCGLTFTPSNSQQRRCGSKQDPNTCSGKIQREQVLKAGRKWREANKDYRVRWRAAQSPEWHEQNKENARQYYHQHKRKQNGKSRDRYTNIKKYWIFVLGEKCQNCGYSRNWAAMDFHHKNTEDKEYSGDWKKKEFGAKIQAGLIVLLCANCHRELHHADCNDYVPVKTYKWRTHLVAQDNGEVVTVRDHPAYRYCFTCHQAVGGPVFSPESIKNDIELNHKNHKISPSPDGGER